MNRSLAFGLGCGVVILLLGATASGRAGEEPARPTPEDIEFFEAKVRPILVRRCQECHGVKQQKGGLRLDAPESMRAGGVSGSPIVPGNPEESLLVEAIRHEGDLRMPPKQKLDTAEVGALTEWVKRGAPWPSTGTAPVPTVAAPTGTISEAARAFWSFQPVKDTPAPAVRDATWCKTSIDPFLLAKLEETGLRPAPPADKRTLLRRVTFDLIGLPPTPEEIDSFLADESPDAFARVVDRLLASPHYGERWGRYWLDVARYGEDQAHSFQPRLYPNGYRYRDWVVKALNDDMPYDRFVREQIAADLLDEDGRAERLPALGFFACGPVYYGDPKKFDQIDDRIDTLMRGFLGLTVACARCHDHKFDPIPQADYYALAGVFASTDYEEAPLAPPETVQAYDRAQAAIKVKTAEIDAFLKSEAERLVESRVNDVARYVVAAWDFARERRAEAKVDAREFAKRNGLDPSLFRRWTTYLDADSPRAHLTAWSDLIARLKSKGEAPDEVEARLEAEQIAASLGQKVRDVKELRKGRSAGTNAGGGNARKAGAPDPETALFDDLLGEQGILTVAKDRMEASLPEDSRSRLTSLRSAMEKMKTEAPAKYPVVHALKDQSGPVKMALLIRGNPDTPGPTVEHRFLSVLGGTPLAKGSGRLELAQAIASPDNPLTARVLVNRIWQHHFGRGLVGTPSNFGTLGERPSHPELLDHLAARFVAGGWSIKTLHRTILLSATYQQSSKGDSRGAEIDPENRLLGRMSRRRLDVEAWRDAMLAVAGRLDLTLGGPPRKIDDPENRRRTLYAAISRHDLAPLLRLFDFPDPNITSAERTKTTVPLQQLVVLNDDLLVASARALAARVRTAEDEGGATSEAAIRRAYALLFGRPATDREVRIGLEYLNVTDPETIGSVGLTRWERYAQALLGTNEFLYVD